MRKIQHELNSLGASRKLVTSQLSAHPLGGAVGEPANSLLSRVRVVLITFNKVLFAPPALVCLVVKSKAK